MRYDYSDTEFSTYSEGVSDALDAILAVVQIAGGCPELGEAERRVRALVGGA